MIIEKTGYMVIPLNGANLLDNKEQMHYGNFWDNIFQGCCFYAFWFALVRKVNQTVWSILWNYMCVLKYSKFNDAIFSFCVS